ncbi:DUF5316 domain-containing protein [Oceanobacillus halophilus]|uniref:DUF5316 domain-containing protein n=1 Tax=Oceanobacillus halophilus TaxID=930130 RepID=A0A494ZTJ2_9BACI|nr:DUF5316 domain-containing protein [Oceanobacillus halophilus]RKQ28655.1 hypothetical protein D8M06_18690 [Oceanobacillus halophilus]
MKKSFLIGCGISLIILVTGLITNNYVLYANILLGIGIITVLISALLSGAFLSGPEIRANYHTETKEHREKRTKTMTLTGVFAIPHLVTAALLLLL